MRPALIAVLALSLLGLGATSSSAADLKIGVVDVQYVLQKSKAGKSAKTKLKSLFDKKQKAIDDKQKTLLDLKAKIENPSGMTTPEKRKELLQSYQKGLMELQEEYLKNQQELQKKEVDLMKPILKKLEKVLTTMATDGGFDMILNRSEHGVLFTKPAFNISDDVLKKLNAG
ncbi:MAG: outer membrane protein [Myxococcota bacterium]|jgi:outer membrane protein